MSNSVAVIASFYNNAALFRRSLWGFAAQEHKDFKIIVADDGSNSVEIDEVAKTSQELGLDLTHVWHEDVGFRKAKILNEAIAHSNADILIFVDADMIPRRDFVGNHVKLLHPGFFISGGSHLHLPANLQQEIQRSTVEGGQLFDWEWLRQYDVEAGRFKHRLGKTDRYGRVMDWLFPRWHSFVGCNSSCWRSDALAVNGFDEDWGYGGTDREFGLRLTSAGVKSRRHQFSLIALHQEHGRPYRDPVKVSENKRLLKKRLAAGVTWIDKGIDSRNETDSKILYQTKP